MEPTMKKLPFYAVLLLVIDVAAADLYIAPTGADANPGTADRPLATLAGSRDALRRLRQATTQPAAPVTIWLKGATYVLTDSFTLESRDSGTKDSPVTYRATPGETVTIVGGIRLPWSAFKPVADPHVLERIVDEGARPHLLQVDLNQVGLTRFDPILPRGFPHPVKPAPPELFCGGRPMTLARWPNDGFAKTGPTFGPATQLAEGGKSAGQPIFEYGEDRPRFWTKAADIWLVGYWKFDWAEEAIRVAGIDPEHRRITLAAPHVYGVAAGKPYFAENLLEEIDQPGEYYLDRETGRLYWWPPEGAGDNSLIQLSTLAAPLIVLNDASWITIRGLTFEAGRGDGVLIKGGSNLRIAGCTLRNLGDRAVVAEGGTDHGVVSCEIYNTGEGGISLTGGDRPSLKSAGHFADNNHIHDYSRRGLTYRPAITLSGVGCRAAHNLIHDAPHSAIFFWGNDHVIEYNEIHHVLKQTGDGGAVYTGRDWTFQGNIIRYNFFHDLQGIELWENAVYIDDQAGGMHIHGNIFHNCHWGMLIGGGRDNVIENNLFSSCKLALQLDARGLGWGKDQLGPTLREHLAEMPYKQEPWAKRYPRLVDIADDEPMTPKHNLIRNNVLYRSGKLETRIDPAALRNCAITGNLETDDNPGFVDPEHLRFGLRPDARLRELVPAFEAIPVEQIGPQPDEYRTKE